MFENKRRNDWRLGVETFSISHPSRTRTLSNMLHFHSFSILLHNTRQGSKIHITKRILGRFHFPLVKKPLKLSPYNTQPPHFLRQTSSKTKEPSRKKPTEKQRKQSSKISPQPEEKSQRGKEGEKASVKRGSPLIE